MRIEHAPSTPALLAPPLCLRPRPPLLTVHAHAPFPHGLLLHAPLEQNLTKHELAQLERDFLKALDYNVGVKAMVYTDWYFKVCTLAERNDRPLRPLACDEAHFLEIRGELIQKKLASELQSPHSDPMLQDGNPGPSPRSRVVIS